MRCVTSRLRQVKGWCSSLGVVLEATSPRVRKRGVFFLFRNTEQGSLVA
jgi:hypothetical protein